MASSVIYQSPHMGSTGPVCSMANLRLQRVHYLDQLCKGKYQRNQNTSQSCQHQIKSQLKSYSSEQQNKMLECTNNLIPFCRDFRYSSVFRKSGKLNQFVEPAERSLKDALCFLCNRTIKENHFEEHLFFGGVRCTLCHEQFLNCQDFQLMRVNNKMVIVPCKHSLQYCSDPFDFIGEKLLGDSTSLMNGSVTPLSVLKKLSFYVSILDVLENKNPWRSAIFKCKLFFLSVTESLGNMKSLSNLNSDIVKSIPVITPTPVQENSYRTDRGKFDTAGKEKFHATESFETSQDIYIPLKQNCYKMKRQIPEDDAEDLLLSEEYDFEQLEQSVEYVEVAGLIKFPYSTCDNKPRPHKKRKGIKSGLRPIFIEKDKPEEQTIEYIETPENGYYFVVRQAIEECPMCYTVICPSEFNVNSKTFLMTTICSYCFLTIYINIESRDNVSIVTDGIKKAQQSSSSIENKV